MGSENNDETLGFIKARIEDILCNVRDNRNEVNELKKEIVKKEDLQANKEQFTEKIKEITKLLKENEVNLDEISERLEVVEDKVEAQKDLNDNVKSFFKWLGLSIVGMIFSGLASFIPMWLGSQHHNPPATQTYTTKIHASHVDTTISNP